MSTVAATVFGVEEILTAFEEQAPKPYFAIYVKNAPVLSNIDNNIDVAKDKIKRKVEEYLRAQFNEVFTIRMYNAQPKNKGMLWDKDEPCFFLYCQAKRVQAQSVGQMDGNFYPIYNLIEKQNEIISALTPKVNAIEETEISDEQIGTAETQMIDKINGFVNSPLGVLVATYLPRVFDKILPPQKTVSGLAGTDPTDLEQTINILYSKGVTLEHLQKLAAMPEAKIKMLLTML